MCLHGISKTQYQLKHPVITDDDRQHDTLMLELCKNESYRSLRGLLPVSSNYYLRNIVNDYIGIAQPC